MFLYCPLPENQNYGGTIQKVFHNHLCMVKSAIKSENLSVNKYHEHFVLPLESLRDLKPVHREYWVENFLDTKDTALLKKNYWLKFRTEPNGNVIWSLKLGSKSENNMLVYQVIDDETEIQSFLKTELRSNGSHILQMCPIPLAVFHTWRYYIVRKPDHQFWVDVSKFEDKYYVIATIEQTIEQDLSSQNVPPPYEIYTSHSLSASKVVAFLHGYNRDHYNQITNATPPFEESFHKFNPFGDVEPEQVDFTTQEELEEIQKLTPVIWTLNSDEDDDDDDDEDDDDER
eukprot:TRINITY_DN3842_c2_g1_i1.p1 TRINITY_DN3842_c2_g1~~TRINITY_DN3842_c2_g1_i1.p1  ORF type:complete len:287 (+),score=43.08 TRINITY_DN3842_c2_g1_i1:122-982(+)